MGSKLKLEILTAYPSGVGATYRYTGRVMGLPIDFSETVTRFVAGREKVWQTIGCARSNLVSSSRVFRQRVREDRRLNCPGAAEPGSAGALVTPERRLSEGPR